MPVSDSRESQEWRHVSIIPAPPQVEEEGLLGSGGQPGLHEQQAAECVAQGKGSRAHVRGRSILHLPPPTPNTHLTSPGQLRGIHTLPQGLDFFSSQLKGLQVLQALLNVPQLLPRSLSHHRPVTHLRNMCVGVGWGGSTVKPK